MPQRTRLISKDSSHSLSPNDVPWFCNFGKFLLNENADFLLITPSNYPKTAQPSLLRKKRFVNTEDACDPGVLYINQANVNSTTSHEESKKRTDRLLRAHRGHRIVSEVPLLTSKNTHFPRDQMNRKDINSMQSDRSDDLAPSSLGSMLRRMVSFDNHGKGLNDIKLHEDTAFSHPVKVSKALEVNINTNEGSTFDYQYQSSFNARWSEGTVSQIENSPSQDSRRQKKLDRDHCHQDRRKRRWRQTSELDEPSTRDLGSMIRRMISFEKCS